MSGVLPSAEAHLVIAEKMKRLFTNPASRVLFVAPPEIQESNFRIPMARNKRYACFPPYGIGLLSQYLERRGYHADIVDLNFNLLKLAHESPEAFQFSAWKSVLRKKLDEYKPDVVGVSCMFTMGHSQMLATAEAVKEYDPSIVVVGGGVHPSNDPKRVLDECPFIDFIGMYESEISFPTFLDVANDKKPSLALTQVASVVEGAYVVVPNRSLPIQPEDLNTRPKYFDLPIGEYSDYGQIGAYYFLHKKRTSTILGKKGCRAKCSFCSVRSFNGPGVRNRGVAAIADELQWQVETYGNRHFMWLDDDLFNDHDETVELFNEIVRRNLKITWDATNGVIAAFLTPEIMQAASESGCIGLALGIESGNPEILRSVHKPGTVDSFRKAKILLDKYPHVFVRGFLIIGFLDKSTGKLETMRQLLDTVNLSIELGFDWYPVQVMNFLPSTELYKTALQVGLLEDSTDIGNDIFIGPAGKQRLREEREKISALEFVDLFQVRNIDTPLLQEDLADLRTLVSHKVNYENILTMQNPVKLDNKRRMLTHICDQLTFGNAIGNLFLAVTEQKLGNSRAAAHRVKSAEEYAAESDYWKKRFNTLGLSVLAERIKSNDFATPR